MSALAKQRILAAGKQLVYLSADEGPEREFTRGWNAYVRGEPCPWRGGQEKDGWLKAKAEYGGATMKNMVEVIDE